MEAHATTNCFEISKLPSATFHLYREFYPPLTKKGRDAENRRRLVAKLQDVLHPQVFTPRGIYDGDALIYFSKRLSLLAGREQTWEVSLSRQNTTVQHTNGRGVYRVIMKETDGDPIRPEELKKILFSGGNHPNYAPAMNLLQLLISQYSNQKYPHRPNGKTFFVPHEKKPIGRGLELWPGFFQSVRLMQQKVVMNIDTTAGVMYADKDLPSLACDLLGKNDIRALQLRENDHDFVQLRKFLKKLIIIPGSPLRQVEKRIFNLVPFAGDYEFTENDEKTTIQRYYYSKYNFKLKFPRIFGVLVSGPNAPFPVIYPAELCRVRSGQLYKQRLSPQQTNEMIRHSIIPPGLRLDKICGTERRGMQGNAQRPETPLRSYAMSEFVKELGMKVETSPVNIRGQVLAAPPVVYGNGAKVQPNPGAWNLKNTRFYNARSLSTWGVLSLSPTVDVPFATRLIQGLITQCSKLGMDIKQPKAVSQGGAQATEQSLVNLVRIAFGDISHAKNFQFIVVIIPNASAVVRGNVKRWGDIMHGVRTLCVRDDKVKTAKDQYWANVALKLNARLGGYNSIVQNPTFDKLKGEPFMIMGADVGHAGPGHMRPSVASLVASMEKQGAGYIAFTSIQEPHVERVVELKDMVKQALAGFDHFAKCKPRNIVFYRDGLSEGEIPNVGVIEVKEIRAAIDEHWAKKGYTEAKPKLTFIVVGKRHHILFFPRAQTGDNKGNCRAGFTTSDLANPSVPICDFYLQSHTAVKGTSRSGHYMVLVDEVFNNNKTDIQNLSYALCHSYAKATTSVSIPAPVYYADLACSRAAFHFDPTSQDYEAESVSSGSRNEPFDLAAWRRAWRPVHKNLQQTMYYL